MAPHWDSESTALYDIKYHRICVLTRTDSIILSQLEKKNPQINSSSLIQQIFSEEMPPGQYSGKWNNLHLYACLRALSIFI